MNLLFELCVVENSLVKNVFFFSELQDCVLNILFSPRTRMELVEKRQVPAVGLWFNMKRGKNGTAHNILIT